MKFSCFIKLVFISVVLSLSLCSNSSNSVDGGSGTDIVCKVVEDNSFKPIAKAKIEIKPANYIPGDSLESNEYSFSGVTNNNGICSLNTFTNGLLPTGEYVITIVDSLNRGRFRKIDFNDLNIYASIKENKNSANELRLFRSFRLSPNGSASGYIAKGSQNTVTSRAVAYITGTRYMDTCNDSGFFFIDSLPAGDILNINFIDLEDTADTAIIETLNIISNVNTNLDTISIKGIASLKLVNNYPSKLDTLYTLSDSLNKSYFVGYGSTVYVKTDSSYKGFVFSNWSQISGVVEIKDSNSCGTIIAVDSNAIVKAIYNDKQAPAELKNIKTDVIGNQVTISWSPSSDNDTIKEYLIIYHHQIDTSIIDTYSYSDTTAFFEGLFFENAQYTCTLYAVDPSGNTTEPKILSFITDKNDNTPPVFNSTIKLSKLNSTYASIYWEPAVDELGIRKYEIIINETYQEFKTECFYDSENLTPGDTFQVKIRAFDYYDNVSDWISSAIILPTSNDTLAPSIPLIDSGFATAQEISFSWSPSKDNVSDTVSYEIKYEPTDTGSIVNPVLINVKNITEYTIAGLERLTEYRISIRAYDLAWYYSPEDTLIISTK